MVLAVFISFIDLAVLHISHIRIISTYTILLTEEIQTYCFIPTGTFYSNVFQATTHVPSTACTSHPNVLQMNFQTGKCALDSEG